MNKKYTFLDNKPTGEDLFEGKSQERTANVLIDILKDNKFQVIGIDGGWGVGKSNLVRIVEEKLKDREFFIYDVWGHQEDDQRRSLLIELTEFLIGKDKKIFKSDKWKNKLTRLLSKKKEITTENLPFLSAGFIWSLLMIIYTPTVITFRDELSNWLNIEKIFWKATLVFFPIAIVLIIYIYYFIKNWIKKGFLNSFYLSFQETFQVYTNKQTRETKIESISEEEPSVRDFQNWMSEIDNDLENKKIILVLDNFDRLPKEYILSIWSSIHVFFAEKNYNNIKIIITFDRKHIKNAFLNLNGKLNDEDFANDYINKTFDIVFRVSSPILSSWKSFLKNNWEKAFSEFNKDEYEKVEQAYEILRPIITPREIIAFINSFISQKLLEDSIPDRYIAIYLLCEQTVLEDPLKAITELKYLHGLELMYKDDEEFEKNITALAFQIKPENALEVIYKKQLFNSLVNEDINEFMKISKINIFPSIIHSVVSSLSDFRKPIIVLDHLKSIDQVSSSKKMAIWQTIFSKVRNLELEENGIEEFQLLLLKNLKETNRKKYLKLLINKFSIVSDNFDYGLYIKNLNELEIFCLSEELELNPFDYINELQVNPEELKFFIDETKGKFVKYKLVYDLDEVDEYLASLTVNEIEKNSFIEYLFNRNELKGFITHLYDLLKNNKSNLIDVLSILKFLKLCSNDRLDVTDILTDAEIYSLSNQFSGKDEFPQDLAALRISLLTKSSASYNPAYVNVLNNDSKEYHLQVANEIEWFIYLDELLVGSLKFNNPLTKGVIHQLLDINPSNRSLEIDPILENLIEICNINELDSDSVLRMIDNSGVEVFDFDRLYKLKSEVLDILVDSDSKIAKNAIKLFKEYLNKFTKDQWEKEFSNIDSFLFKQLKSINYNEWNVFALEEFNNLLLRIADKETINNEDSITWIITSFESNNRDLQNEFINLRDRFILTNKMSEVKFRLLISSLIRHGKLNERSEDVLRTIFKSEFLDDNSCVDLMLDFSQFIKELLDFSGSSKSRFRDGLAARIHSDKIEELSRRLDFRIKDDGQIDF